MKIAIEGLDGCGKTTVAKAMSQHYKCKYVDKSFKFILNKYGEPKARDNEELRKYEKVVCNCGSNMIKAMYYAIGNLHDLLDTEDVIIDRYLGSNYFWNGDSETERLFAILADITKDKVFSVILYASLSERKKRIVTRNTKDSDLKYKELNIDNYDKLLSFYQKYNIPHCIINVDGKSIGEVNNEVIERIDEYLNEKSI